MSNTPVISVFRRLPGFQHPAASDAQRFQQGTIDRYYDPAENDKQGAIIERFPPIRPLHNLLKLLKRMLANDEPLQAISQSQLSASDVYKRALHPIS